MTDELARLKAEAGERRAGKTVPYGDSDAGWDQAEAALDRAIAIAEQISEEWRNKYDNLEVELCNQRDQARADVLSLRDDIHDIHVNFLHQGLDCDTHCESLADTEHYEQFRQPTEVSNG